MKKEWHSNAGGNETKKRTTKKIQSKKKPKKTKTNKHIKPVHPIKQWMKKSK